MKKISDEVLNAFKENEKFLILVHRKPDGDAIGSAIAMGKGLKQLHKTVDYYIELPVEDRLNFFDEIKTFNPPLRDAYDVIVYLDCSTPDFSFSPFEMPEGKMKLVIDHHTSNGGYGDLNYIEITSATAEIVYRILCALDVQLDAEMADAIFTGISTDTGSFQFSNVIGDTHRILSELYQIQENYTQLSERLHTQKTFNQTKLMGVAIQSLEIMTEYPIAIMRLDYENIVKFGGTINILDNIANIGINVTGIELSAFLKESRPGMYQVSLRSRDPYDVHKVALKYGGGGHERAAGFSFSGDFDKLKKDLIAVYRNGN